MNTIDPDTSRSGNQLGTDFGLLLLRLGFGITMAVQHGFGKIPVSEKLVGGAKKLGLSFPPAEILAWAAALSEAAGGIMIAAGLLTRVSSFFLGVTMGVAAFVIHADDPFNKKELALAYGVVSLVLLFSGPGRFSIDQLLFGRKKS